MLLAETRKVLLLKRCWALFSFLRSNLCAVHPRVTGNSAKKIIGRTGSSEVNAPDYWFLDQDIRIAVTRLAKGELLISHVICRQPVKVNFLRSAYKKEQSEPELRNFYFRDAKVDRAEITVYTLKGRKI
jgi:hypothetical protein